MQRIIISAPRALRPPAAAPRKIKVPDFQVQSFTHSRIGHIMLHGNSGFCPLKTGESPFSAARGRKQDPRGEKGTL